MITRNGIDVIRTAWFNPSGLNIIGVGIVYGRDQETGEIKAYIGTAFGIDEVQDINSIAESGAKFPAEAAAVLFGLSRAKADPAKKALPDPGQT